MRLQWLSGRNRPSAGWSSCRKCWPPVPFFSDSRLTSLVSGHIAISMRVAREPHASPTGRPDGGHIAIAAEKTGSTSCEAIRPEHLEDFREGCLDICSAATARRIVEEWRIEYDPHRLIRVCGLILAGHHWSGSRSRGLNQHVRLL